VPVPEPVIAPGELVSLREACEAGVLTLRYNTARKAKQQDREFPAAVTHGLYRPEALSAWQANRPRRVRAAD